MDLTTIIVAGVTAAIGVTGAAFALSAIGLNVQFGLARLINFGHVSFMLAGAYGFAIVSDPAGLDWPTWAGVIAGLAAGAVLAVLLGVPTLRLRGDYLAIVTIAAAEILRLLASSRWADPVTHGPRGIQSAGADVLDANPYPSGRYGLRSIAGWQIDLVFSARQIWMMTIAWTLVALAMLAMWRLTRSPWGRLVRAIGDDEDAVSGVGKNVFAYKLQALIVGGVLAALAGIVLAIDRQNVSPGEYRPLITFYIYTIVIVGGPATLWGPLIGTLVFWFLFQALDVFLRQAVAEGWFNGVVDTVDVGAIRFAFVGLSLMLLMIFRPQGFFGSRQEQMIGAR